MFVFEFLPYQATTAVCDQCGKRNFLRGTVDLKVDSIPTIGARVCECVGREIFEELDPEAQLRALYNGTFT